MSSVLRQFPEDVVAHEEGRCRAAPRPRPPEARRLRRRVPLRRASGAQAAGLDVLLDPPRERGCVCARSQPGIADLVLARTTDLPPELVWVGRHRAGNPAAPAPGRGFVVPRSERAAGSPRRRPRPHPGARDPARVDRRVDLRSTTSGHIQATGRDARGRKQYRYHTDFRAHREQVKFARLYEFGTALPLIRKQVADDLTRRGMPREKVVADRRATAGGDARARRQRGVRAGEQVVRADDVARPARAVLERRAATRVQGQARHRGERARPGPPAARVVKQCQDLPGPSALPVRRRRR